MWHMACRWHAHSTHPQMKKVKHTPTKQNGYLLLCASKTRGRIKLTVIVIGMTIRKGIVVPFLPCLVAFWGFHPYMFFHFFFMFFCYFIYRDMNKRQENNNVDRTQKSLSIQQSRGGGGGGGGGAMLLCHTNNLDYQVTTKGN